MAAWSRRWMGTVDGKLLGADCEGDRVVEIEKSTG